jgi:hypothetical protein
MHSGDSRVERSSLDTAFYINIHNIFISLVYNMPLSTNTTSPQSLREKIHGIFLILLLVVGVFGGWLYIVLEKTLVDIESIAGNIHSQKIIAHSKKLHLKQSSSETP